MGVTVMVAVLGLVPWLTAVNDGGYPVPEDDRPMAGLEFVQELICHRFLLLQTMALRVRGVRP